MDFTRSYSIISRSYSWNNCRYAYREQLHNRSQKHRIARNNDWCGICYRCWLCRNKIGPPPCHCCGQSCKNRSRRDFCSEWSNCVTQEPPRRRLRGGNPPIADGRTDTSSMEPVKAQQTATSSANEPLRILSFRCGLSNRSESERAWHLCLAQVYQQRWLFSLKN